MPPRRTPRSLAAKSTLSPKVSANPTPPKTKRTPKSKSLESNSKVGSASPANAPVPETSVPVSPITTVAPPKPSALTTLSSPETTTLTAFENAGGDSTTVSVGAVDKIEAVVVGERESLPEKVESGTGAKRTVRVVKKIVKRKIFKKVQKGTSAAKLNDDQRNPDRVEVQVNNPEHVDSVPMEVENCKSSALVDVEIEHREADVVVSVDAEKPSLNLDVSVPVLVPVEVEKPSTDADEVDSLNRCELSEGEKCVSLVASASEVPAVTSGVDENEKRFSVTQALLEDSIVSDIPLINPGFDGGEKGCVSECLSEDSNVVSIGEQTYKKYDDGANLEGHKGEEAVKLQPQKSVSECIDMKIDTGLNDDIDGEKRVKEHVENSEVSHWGVEHDLGHKMLLSGEMEALERRRKRQTEIFIGGLDAETEEVDIRKVFEEVGKIIEATVVKDGKTGKGKGFAFVRYALAADAKKALMKYRKVEIRGKQCGTAPVEGNDTIFLGNIDRKWREEDILKLLQEIGVEKIDKVSVVADPDNIELNRGFAFVELETKRDAQTAYNKLQKKDAFGKHLKIKVAWAEPLIEPDELEMCKVKSIYAEYLPSTWDEEKVKDYFKQFGEIETVALARNLHSSRRKDFAFINYKSREAALACIEAFSRDKLTDEGTKVDVKVSLAKPMTKGKRIKHIPTSPSTELFKASQSVLKPHIRRNMEKSSSTKREDARVDRRPSTTSELVKLLREQASWSQASAGSTLGIDRKYLQPLAGEKRPIAVVGSDSFYADPRGYIRPRVESAYAIPHPRSLSQGVGIMHSANYDQQGYRLGAHAGYLQTREHGPYHGRSNAYYNR